MRPEVNRAAEMEVFVRAVELESFSAAARACRMTPSAVSKLIARLEARLGTRLINRSTRRLQPTPEGALFFARASRLLAELDEAEREAGGSLKVSGHIRLNVNASYSHHILAPVLPAFVAGHPEVSLEITQTDAVVDLLAARTDVAVRAGPLKVSSLMARKLGATRMVIVGAPGFLARHGTPSSLAELERLHRLGFSYARAVDGWPLIENGARRLLPVRGPVQASDGEALRHLAIGGAGLARLAAFTVGADIEAGRLVPVLEDRNPGDLEEVHAVYLGQGGPLPARVRALLDFLAERGRLPPHRPDHGWRASDQIL